MDFLSGESVFCALIQESLPMRRIVLAMAGVTQCIGVATGTASAQDKSQYTLFNPTPKDKMRDFSTDRPTKSNVPYTVDAGHFQYEGDIFIYTYDNTSTPDINITSWVLGNPTFKAGLTNWMDLEVNFSAFNNIRSQTRATERWPPSPASATP